MAVKYYKLDGKTVVPCWSVLEWGRWFEESDRSVARTEVGDYVVSTVFLGLDHRFSDEGPPLIFETMVFKGDDMGVESCERCSTWEEAEGIHAQTVGRIKALIDSLKRPRPRLHLIHKP